MAEITHHEAGIKEIEIIESPAFYSKERWPRVFLEVGANDWQITGMQFGESVF